MNVKNEKFYLGNYHKDAEKRQGWFVGHFIEKGSRKTDKVEIKYWKFKQGKTNHKKKIQSRSTEITIILRGKIDGEVAGKRIKLKTGEYIVIPPKIVNNFPINTYEDVEGITIKAPSIPGDKIEIK